MRLTQYDMIARNPFFHLLFQQRPLCEHTSIGSNVVDDRCRFAYITVALVRAYIFYVDMGRGTTHEKIGKKSLDLGRKSCHSIVWKQEPPYMEGQKKGGGDLPPPEPGLTKSMLRHDCQVLKGGINGC
jgi:hypothetical protein